MKSFGEHVRELREGRDLSLREFAKKVGRAPAFISDIEHGRRYPSDHVLTDMARVLAVSAEELRAYDPRPPVEALRQRGEKDPELRAALRQLADSDMSGAQLLRLLKGSKGGGEGDS